jgi:glycosyltransferase involved in cell wall biosynthesis
MVGSALVGRPRRLAYLSGPVDAVEVHAAWSRKIDPAYFGTSYLSQFYDLCHELDAPGYVITTLPGEYRRCQQGSFLLENRPAPDATGFRYHVSAATWFARLLPNIVAFRPDILIVTALQNYWFLLWPLTWRRIVVVPSLHCLLWPKFSGTPLSGRILLGLNRYFLARRVRGAIAVSDDIASQVRALTRIPQFRVRTFLPTYPPSQFRDLPEGRRGDDPFRVLFAGRIETNKGIYDLLSMAERLHTDRPGQFHFDVCGEGSELNRVQAQIVASGLAGTVSTHGHCDKARLLALLGASHAVLVPTTSDFEEGFNKVCAEAVLAGRPVITSAVCPALARVRPAAVEVPPDAVDAYCEAIVRLRDDRELYEQKRRACLPLQAQFYDPRNSYGAMLRDAIAGALGRTKALASTDGPRSSR